MNQMKFAEIEPCDSLKELQIPKWTGIFKKTGIQRYLIRTFPHSIETINYGELEGCRIMLPIVKPITRQDGSFIESILMLTNHYLSDYGIQVVRLHSDFMPYRKIISAIVVKEENLGFLLIGRIIKTLRGKLKKEIHVVLVDGNYYKTEFILDQIIHTAFRISILTDRPDLYNKRQEEVYFETGLLFQILGKSLQQTVQGDVFIHTEGIRDKLFFTYSESAYVLDFLSNMEELKNMKNKRKDLKLIYDFDCTHEGKEICKEQLLTGMLCENRTIRGIYVNGYHLETGKKIANILDEEYPCEIHLNCI